jgi:hypothetical protein
MSNKAILRQLRSLERVFAVEAEDSWIDILMWNAEYGGILKRLKNYWLQASTTLLK